MFRQASESGLDGGTTSCVQKVNQSANSTGSSTTMQIYTYVAARWDTPRGSEKRKEKSSNRFLCSVVSYQDTCLSKTGDTIDSSVEGTQYING